MLTAINRRLIKLAIPITLVLLLINWTVVAQTGLRTTILNMTKKLQDDNQVHFGYAVGFAGKPETGNKYYKLYRRLKARATTQELVELSKSKSALVVVYAFNILQERNYDGLKNIFNDHISDTTWFWTAGGCTGLVDRVNWFMLRMLKPMNNPNATGSLTRVEYEMYCRKFKGEDEMFSCN